MRYSFEVEEAVEYGVNAAILLSNIRYWTAHNMANDTNYHDGRYWTYNSAKAFSQLYPFLTKKQIETAINVLRDAGEIVIGNYNDNSWDRTRWYSIGDKGKCKLLESNRQITDREQSCYAEGTSMLPGGDTNTNYKTNINNNNKPYMYRESFTPPSVPEVEEYISSKGYSFSAEEFVAYYDSQGWKKANGQRLTNWKAACVTWQKKESERKATPAQRRLSKEEEQRAFDAGRCARLRAMGVKFDDDEDDV